MSLLAEVGPQWAAGLLQFKTYIALFIVACVCTSIATPIYIAIGRRRGWVDHPGGRKAHERPTVTMGGLVVFAVVIAGAISVSLLPTRVGEMFRAHGRSVWVLLGATVAMMALGIVDDRVGVRPRYKLLLQSVVAIAAIALGYQVQAVTLPAIGSIQLGAAGAILAFIWIVGITNAINLTDGLDGLAAGVGLLAASVNALVAIWLANYYMAVMMCLLAGALLGFLRFNFHPARVFLGDTGALALGMFLALSSLHAAQKAHTVVLILAPVFALGYPILDTLLAVARRMVRGQPLFAGDRDHIHHRLLNRGASPSRAAIQVYAISAALGLVCLAAVAANHLTLGLAIGGVILMAVFGARFLGYLQWGGWAANWRGRSETQVLHAAANLARLKLGAARGDLDAILNALAIAAGEMGCQSITLTVADGTRAWGNANAGADSRVVSVSGENASVRFALSSNATASAEVVQLLEELGGLAVRQAAGTPQN